jgi:hypothetical protein
LLAKIVNGTTEHRQPLVYRCNLLIDMRAQSVDILDGAATDWSETLLLRSEILVEGHRYNQPDQKPQDNENKSLHHAPSPPFGRKQAATNQNRGRSLVDKGRPFLFPSILNDRRSSRAFKPFSDSFCDLLAAENPVAPVAICSE